MFARKNPPLNASAQDYMSGQQWVHITRIGEYKEIVVIIPC